MYSLQPCTTVLCDFRCLLQLVMFVAQLSRTNYMAAGDSHNQMPDTPPHFCYATPSIKAILAQLCRLRCNKLTAFEAGQCALEEHCSCGWLNFRDLLGNKSHKCKLAARNKCMRHASFWTKLDLDLGILTTSDDRLLQPVCVLPLDAD